jgi:hypothetical protein
VILSQFNPSSSCLRSVITLYSCHLVPVVSYENICILLLECVCANFTEFAASSTQQFSCLPKLPCNLRLKARYGHVVRKDSSSVCTHSLRTRGLRKPFALTMHLSVASLNFWTLWSGWMPVSIDILYSNDVCMLPWLYGLMVCKICFTDCTVNWNKCFVMELLSGQFKH